LQAYRPSQLYHLIDEARLKLHPMAEVRNLAEALFRLERSRTPPDMREVLQALHTLLKEPQMQPMRRTVTLWVRSLLRRKAPAANMAEIDAINDILEADTMLAETIGNWFDEATRKGVSQGRQEGRQEGQQQGLVKAVALQLQLRFSPVPEWVQSRLDAADEAQLLAWTGAILSATSLADLFGDDAAAH
jgi:flagellar biosynthesis/type III secretory pathway protein FliH